jgi:hypothetical protein
MADTGHAKILESLGKLIAQSETLDQVRLNPPTDLTIAALNTLRTEATALQTKVGDSKADWRTAAQEIAASVETFASLASQAVAQLEARGATAKTVEQARGYVRKLQGKRSSQAAVDDPTTPDVDESEQSISASQQSRAAQIATFNELIDFLEAQAAYAGVTKPELLVANLRAKVNSAQDKHDDTIESAAALSADRIARDKLFYLDANNICDRAKRFKLLVKGEYGANSPEYQAVNAIPFQKP